MSNLTTLPKGDSAWLLRRSIQRIMQQVSVLETNIGTSTTGNSANTQVIFNDNGTLRGDPDLIFNTALNKLVALNLESTEALQVGTNATITGDLTVRTNKLAVTSTGVGIGTATPTAGILLDVVGGTFARFNKGAANQYHLRIGNSTKDYGLYVDIDNNGTNGFSLYDITASADVLRYIPGASGSWTHYINNSTAMTLNSTGLGVGTAPANDKILSLGSIGILLSGATSDFNFRNVSGTAIQRLRYTDATGGLTIGSATATSYPVELGGSTSSRAIVIDSSVNSIVNVTSAAPALATNNQMVFNLTSNTNLRISVRGTDGTTRTANITLA